MSDEELQTIREDYGVQPWEEGDFVMMPERVKCPHCGASFRAVHLGDD
jgi:ribosomal protein S27AE